MTLKSNLISSAPAASTQEASASQISQKTDNNIKSASPTHNPHEAKTATAPCLHGEHAPSIDFKKVASNAIVDGASLLCTFGASSAGAALLRANPKIAPALAVTASGLQPIVGAVASAYLGAFLRTYTGTSPTEHSKYKPLQDASSPIGFMVASEVFRLQLAPLLKPLSQLSGPSKLATAMAGPAFAAIGSATGSAIRETSAQAFAHTSEPSHTAPASLHAQAIGRGMTQVGASLVAKTVALQAVAGVPGTAAPWVPRVVGTTFSLRNHMTSEPDKKSGSKS